MCEPVIVDCTDDDNPKIQPAAERPDYVTYTESVFACSLPRGTHTLCKWRWKDLPESHGEWIVGDETSLDSNMTMIKKATATF